MFCLRCVISTHNSFLCKFNVIVRIRFIEHLRVISCRGIVDSCSIWNRSMKSERCISSCGRKEYQTIAVLHDMHRNVLGYRSRKVRNTSDSAPPWVQSLQNKKALLQIYYLIENGFAPEEVWCKGRPQPNSPGKSEKFWIIKTNHNEAKKTQTRRDHSSIASIWQHRTEPESLLPTKANLHSHSPPMA